MKLPIVEFKKCMSDGYDFWQREFNYYNYQTYMAYEKRFEKVIFAFDDGKGQSIFYLDADDFKNMDYKHLANVVAQGIAYNYEPNLEGVEW